MDLPLLNELRGEKCELETLAGACDADCHRRRFRTKLIAMAMSSYDRVVIEPSGVFDMDEFFDTLQESPLDRQYEIGSVIAIVDAMLDEHCSEEEDFFLATQAACAGSVVLSKVQMAGGPEIDHTLCHLREAEKKIGCGRTSEEKLVIRDWNELTDEDFAVLMKCGYQTPEYVKTIAGIQTDFQSLSFLDLSQEGSDLLNTITQMFSDSGYGRILRVKGFFRNGQKWCQMNATAKEIQIKEVTETRSAIIVIGISLNENKISIALTGKVPEHRIL